MSIAQLKDQLPDYARDLKLNLSIVGGTTSELSPRQMWGTALAAAIATGRLALIAAVTADAAQHLDETAQRAARAAAAIMGMNNVYYRFVHFLGEDSDYARMPARLRMQVIGNPGVDALDFELWCLAVSAIHGCQACVRAHEKVVRDKGATATMVQDAVRVAAVLHGVAGVLIAEAAQAA